MLRVTQVVASATVEVGQCLRSFGAESFVFQFASQKYKDKAHRTIVLPVVFYGCETWSVTLREERRLMVFENRVLRRGVTGEWRELHNK
jgi:hypothetical protein